MNSGEFSKIFLNKQRKFEELGFTKDYIIEEYFVKGRAAERIIQDEIFRTLKFSVRSLYGLLKFYGLEKKSKNFQNSDRGDSYSKSRESDLIKELLNKGFDKEKLSEIYKDQSVNQIVDLLRGQGVKIYKDSLNKVLDFHGINKRTVEETYSLRDKITSENLLKEYGVTNPAQIPGSGEKIQRGFIKSLLREKNMEVDDFENLTLEELLILTNDRFMPKRLYTAHSFKFIRSKYSKPEMMFLELLEDSGLKESIDFIHSNRRVISPFEIDFWFPDLKLGVEINPAWTHSVKGGFSKIDRNYHFNKTETMLEKGFDLIHLFEEADYFKALNKILGKTISNYDLTGERKIIIDSDLGRDRFLESQGFHLTNHLKPQKEFFDKHGSKIDFSDLINYSQDNMLTVYRSGFFEYSR